MIYDLLIVFPSFFVTVPLEMVPLTTSRIYLMIYLIYIFQILTKYVINLAKKILCKLIGCEAQEGAE